MASHLSKVFWVVGIVSFGSMAYLGYQFIDEAGQSASGIQSNIPANKTQIDFAKLNDHAPTIAQPLSTESKEIASTGDDLQIKAGEFAYQHGQPTVRLAVHNRSRFPITAVAINLSLVLNDEQEANAKAENIPYSFSTPLLPNADFIIQIPVADDAWRTEQVQNATQRRVWAQVVSVSDGDRDNIDYPQTSVGVFVKQTVNDWSVAPIAQNTLPESSSHVHTPPPDFIDPTANMVLETPKPMPMEQPFEPAPPVAKPKTITPPDYAEQMANSNHDIANQLLGDAPLSDATALPSDNHDSVFDNQPEPTQSGVISYEFKEFER